MYYQVTHYKGCNGVTVGQNSEPLGVKIDKS